MNKKILFLTLTLFSGFACFAQMTGGGTGQSNQVVKSKDLPSFKWRSFSAGLSNPMGKFKENNLTVPYDQAVGAKPGFYFAYEAANYFRESTDPFRIGLSSLATLAYNDVNWSSWVQNSSFNGKAFIIAEAKLGVVGTYELSQDMYVDGFIRIGANFGVPGSGHWEYASSSSSYYPSYTNLSSSFGSGFGTNLGANFRWKALLVSMQVNTGKLKCLYEYEGNGAGSNVTYSVPISSFHLGAGVVLGKKSR